MVDMNKLLGSFLGSSAATGFAGGLAGGLASNVLTTKKGRKIGKNVLKLGGVAAVGALAYTAYQRYNNTRNDTPVAPSSEDYAAVTPAPAGSLFMPEESNQVANESLGLTLVRAMIAVARADGRLDAQESQAIFQRIETLGLDSESQSLLVREMGHPVDVDAIVNSANGSPEIAAEIYVASLLAVDVDTAAEKAYLSMLAARLQLPAELVAELEHQVEAQKMFAQ
jgi:uncharacterized membrane protein YebE (DUF533 family)